MGRNLLIIRKWQRVGSLTHIMVYLIINNAYHVPGTAFGILHAGLLVPYSNIEIQFYRGVNKGSGDNSGFV